MIMSKIFPWHQLHLLFYGFVLLLTTQCYGYKILVMPQCGRSHVMAVTVLSQELVRRGHVVHMLLGATYKLTPELSSNDSKIHIERYGSPDVKLDYDAMQDSITSQMLESNAGKGDLRGMIKEFVEEEINQLLVDNDEMLEKLRKIGFDIAIVDTLFFMKSYYLIPLSLGIPTITYSDQLPYWNARTPYLPSFVPSKMSPYTDKMTFFQRVKNLFLLAAPIVMNYPDPPEHILKKYRKYSDFNVVGDLISRSVLYIVTSDPVLDYPTPTMPNIIQVGGMSVNREKAGKLPEELDRFMASGRDGVILVTFGSMASRLPKRIAEKFLETFQRLPNYKVIWRFNNKDNLAIPDNVMLASWLPQNDILGDPRVKLFITHSGNNGQFEALYHAVPMIGFPIMGDQIYNAQRLKAKGFGIPMALHEFTSEELEENIVKIIKDPSYKARIKKASEIFSSRETPSEKAAYWIEHVVKFGGEHLRSSGSDLNVFQYYMLDVALFLIIVLLLVVLAATLLFWFVVSRLRAKYFNFSRLTFQDTKKEKLN